MAWSAAEHQNREEQLAQFMRDKGLEVYVPDVDAFRTHAQQR